MDPTSQKILLGGGLSDPGEEYIGTYRFYTPQSYLTYTWQVPADVVYIQAFCVGSGGRPDGFSNGISGGDGGGGGCSIAVIPVTPGETLKLGVGGASNNASSGKTFGGGGGGFSGLFRSSTNVPIIIAGGGGGGQVNGTHRGGAGGGLTAQSSSDGYAGGGQSAASGGSGYLSSGTGGGGGYYGGAGNQWYNASGGGSGYIGATGNLHAQTATGSNRNIPSLASGNRDYQLAPNYPSSGAGSNLGFGYGGYGNDSGNSDYGSGLVVIHTLGSGYDTSSPPTIPYNRTVLATY